MHSHNVNLSVAPKTMPTTQSSFGRSTPCNGRLISLLRKQLGWTQSELAERAGFTERLIAKAEASQNIAATTLKIIAQTLSEAGTDVSTQDLSAEPAALAKLFFLSTYECGPHCLEVNSHFISNDIVVHFAGDPSVFPFSGTHSGIDAAKLAFAKFYEVIAPPKDHSEVENIQFISTGHGALVWGETWAHPIGMPMAAPMKFAIKMDFKDGLMTMFDSRFDTLEGAKLFEKLRNKS